MNSIGIKFKKKSRDNLYKIKDFPFSFNFFFNVDRILEILYGMILRMYIKDQHKNTYDEIDKPTTTTLFNVSINIPFSYFLTQVHFKIEWAAELPYCYDSYHKHFK